MPRLANNALKLTVDSLHRGIDTETSALGVQPDTLLDVLNMHLDDAGKLQGRYGYNKYESTAAIDASGVEKGGFDFHRPDDATQHEIVVSEYDSGGGVKNQIHERNGTGWDLLKADVATGRPSFGVMNNLALINADNRDDTVYAYDSQESLDSGIRELGIVKPGFVFKATGERTDYSSEAADTSIDANAPFVDLSALSANSFIYVGMDLGENEDGSPIPPTNFAGIMTYLDGTNVNATASVLTVQYPIKIGGGITWTDSQATDGTTEAGATFGKTSAGFYRISWNSPYDWERIEYDGKKQWWVRMKVSVALDATTHVFVMMPELRTQEMAIRAQGTTTVRTDKINDNDTGTEHKLETSSGPKLGSSAGSFMDIRVRASEGSRFSAVYVNMGTTVNANVNTIDKIFYPTEADPNPTVEGGQFTLAGVTDGTESGGVGFAVDGIIKADIPDDWVTFVPGNFSERGSSGEEMWIWRISRTGPVDDDTSVRQLTPLIAGSVIVDPIVIVDYTSAATDGSASTHVEIGGLDRDSDALYMTIDDITQALGIDFDMDAVNVNTGATLMVFEFWSDLLRWEKFEDYVDETVSSAKALAQDGRAVWSHKPINWITTSINDDNGDPVEGFWVRARPTTADLSGTVNIDEIRMIQSLVPKAKYLTVFSGRVHLANVTVETVKDGAIETNTYPSRSYFSDIREPDEWDVTTNWLNYDEAGEDITGIGSVPDGRHMIVGSDSSLWATRWHVTTTPEFSVHRLSSEVGITSHWSITQGPGLVAWWAAEGPYKMISRGGTSGVEALSPPIEIGQPLNGYIHGTQDGRFSGINKDRLGDIVGVYWHERRQMRWLFSRNGASVNDAEFVYDLKRSHPVDPRFQAWTINEYDSDMQGYMTVRDSTKPGKFTLVTGSTNGRWYEQEVVGTYNDDSGSIHYMCEFGWADFAKKTSVRMKNFRKLYAWIWQNASFNLQVGYALDGERSDRITVTVDAFDSNGLDKLIDIGLRESQGRLWRLKLDHDVVDEVFAIKEYALFANPLSELRAA